MEILRLIYPIAKDMHTPPLRNDELDIELSRSAHAPRMIPPSQVHVTFVSRNKVNVKGP